MQSHRSVWLSPKIYVPMMVGGLAFLLLAAVSCIPETSLDDSIGVSGDDHPYLSLPTTGKISRYSREAPRYLIFWAGRVDQPRLDDWIAKLDKSKSQPGWFAAFPSESEVRWPDGVQANLSPDLLSKPFIAQGDMIRDSSTTRGQWYYHLRVNDATGAFMLMRTINEDYFAD